MTEPDRPPIEVPAGIRRCPSCTWTNDSTRTYGCEECTYTGRARRWKLEAQLVGGHHHVVVRAGRPGARAVVGKMTMDEHDWSDLKQQIESINNLHEIGWATYCYNLQPHVPAALASTQSSLWDIEELEPR